MGYWFFTYTPPRSCNSTPALPPDSQYQQYRAEITCYTYNVKGKQAVGSTFPGQAPLTQSQAATKVQAAFRGLNIRRQHSGSSRGNSR